MDPEFKLTVDVDTSVGVGSATPPTRRSLLRRAATLDQEIETLRSTLNSLISERETLQQRIDAYAYPVLSLPDEIVSEIFQQYLPPYPFCPPLYGEESPTHLTQICRAWRSIAYNTPQLWQAIWLFSVRRENPYEEDILEAERWLQRSRSLPLSIAMLEGDEDSRAAALVLLLKHKARWEHVLLKYPSAASTPDATQPLGALPALRSIAFVGGGHEDDLFAIEPGPWQAPNLRVVGLYVNKSDSGTLALVTPAAFQNILRTFSAAWFQLTHLALTKIMLESLPPILQCTPALVRCSMEIDSSESDFSSQVIHLDHLEGLTVIVAFFADNAPTLRFLHLLRTPGLQYLFVDELTIDTLDSLEKLFESLGLVEPLNTLHIVDRTLTAADYQQKFPHISSIILRHFYPHVGEDLPVGHWDFAEHGRDWDCCPYCSSLR